MTNYVLDGHNLSALFDTSISPISFSEDPRNHIPKTGSIIYSVWDKNENFIYIGISGLQKSLNRRSPLSRMISHSSGVRSGDQFNVYIHDFYVVPTLVQSGKYEPAKGVLDKLTKEYIHQNLSYRFVSFQSEDSDTIVRGLEKQIQSGALGLSPRLNGKTYLNQN